MKLCKIYTDNWLAKIILFPGYRTIMLFGFVLTKEDDEPHITERRHETTHQVQFLECLILNIVLFVLLTMILYLCHFRLSVLYYVIGILNSLFLFYELYGIEYLIGFIFRIYAGVKDDSLGHFSYRRVSFEEEARDLERNAQKFESRKIFRFSFIKYLGNL